MRGRSAALASVVTLSLIATACGSDDAETEPVDLQPADTDVSSADAPAIRIVSPTDAAATLDDPPDDLVVLDVRTAEEFADGHIEGAVMLDFYRDDFAEQIAALDRDVPYVIYCRSGNRSGQTRQLMADLGFEAVDDVDGGVISWAEAGLPFVVTE
ncbi:MAG: rhodanese-like domain-containing protein [Actinomycetota bacterium]